MVIHLKIGEFMKYNRPKRIHFDISEISFGGWQLGNNIDFNDCDDELARSLVEEAFRQGITLFDTAPNYGHGQSERILGRALKEVRNKVFISSKFGHSDQGAIDFSVNRLESSVRGSLARLQTDYLDCLLLHNPPQEMLSKSHPIYIELKRLNRKGLIKFFGVSIDTSDELAEVLKNDDIDAIEIMYNMIHQSPKIWFNQIADKGILLMIKVPLDSGWLTGKYDESTEFMGIRKRWTKDVIKTRVKIVNQIKSIVGEDMVCASLRFILDHPAVTCVIPGSRNVEQLNSNLKASSYKLDPSKYIDIETK